MFKKSLATAVLICTVPAIASASWFLTTRAMNVGGSITSDNMAGQVVTNGAITKSYGANGANVWSGNDITVGTADGNSVRSLVLIAKGVNGMGNYSTAKTTVTSPFALTPVEGYSYEVDATFQAAVITTKAGNNGGTVSPSRLGNHLYGDVLTAPVTFYFAPAAGYTITAINGAPAGITPVIPGVVNKAATVTLPAGYKFTTNLDIEAVSVNTTPSINYIAPQNVALGGRAVNMTAVVNNVSSPSYAWTYVSGPANSAAFDGAKPIMVPGPAVSLTGANTATATLAVPTTAGQYKFLVTVGNLTKIAVVNVVTSASDVANQCQFCHTANGIADQTIGTRYQASIHGQSTTSACSGCHYGTGIGAHPGNVNADTVDPTTFTATIDGVVGGKGNTVNTGTLFCTTCHKATDGTQFFGYGIPHQITGLGATCAGCHTGTNGTNGGFDAHSIQAPSNLTSLTYDLCENCHGQATAGNATGSIAASYKASIHGQSDGPSGHSTCVACHSGSHDEAKHANKTNVDPTTLLTLTATVTTAKQTLAQGVIFCTNCHNPLPHSANLASGVACFNCHTNEQGSANAVPTGDAHNIKGLSCTGCHSIAQSNPFSDKNLVGDTAGNNGVRAVMGEFGKWSHHIVNANGAAPVDEQCAVCHLEGTVGLYGFGVDGKKHMTDNFIHLRNAQTDADLQWDPTAPNHTTMDNFCMSCHSAAGASSPMNKKLQPLITAATGITASADNPFGDTISNRYDKMQRPRVTNVDDQFNTTNNSHHGVKGKRYTGRTRVAGQARSISAPTSFANNSSALLQGVRSTIYDAGNFNALYVPLGTVKGDGNDLGDDSTLHCGDCHTVGQFKAGASTNMDGSATSVVIGAHGSNNEYLLRNNLGTDARHTAVAYTLSATNVVTVQNPNAALLVCFNCHTYKNYGSVYVGTGADAGNATSSEMGNVQPHVGEYAQAGRCNGPGNTISFAGYTTGAATDGTQFMSRIDGLGAKATGEQTPQFGNIFGIQCLNCHNSGYGNAYGGIHGSANNTSWTKADGTVVAPVASVTGGAYIDGAGNTNKVERFLPGLNDAMHVPGTLGGVNGGTTYSVGSNAVSNDTNWEQKHWQQKAGMVINYKTGAASGLLAASAGAGCYTLGEGATAVNVTAGLEGPSVTGATGAATEGFGTWGACDDHSAAQGAANHGFVKRIVRPVTY